MISTTILFQCIVGISILNVWLVQNKKETQWRGGEAKTIFEEFEVYGLPSWSLYVVGFFKVLAAICLIASIWYTDLKLISALVLALFLSGSVIVHLIIKDPLKKSIPALIFLFMCVYIAYS